MTVRELLDNLPQVGRVEWIGLSPGNRGEIRSVERARVEVGTGLEGDYHVREGRDVTFIQHEHMAVLSALVGREVVPQDLRRNVVVSGLNLAALKDQRFRAGEALFECTGPCRPCGRIEENLGPGGMNAARGHAGITSRVLEGGSIGVGDPVRFVSGDDAEG